MQSDQSCLVDQINFSHIEVTQLLKLIFTPVLHDTITDNLKVHDIEVTAPVTLVISDCKWGGLRSYEQNVMHAKSSELQT